MLACWSKSTSLAASQTAYLACKSAVEWIVSLVLLLLAAPLIALTALLVRWGSPGPAFYHQIRLGKGGRPFTIHKMRTMTHNCERATGAVWATPHDPRITPLGRFLRETHFDEVPQLWNVLRGQMSLIGPRPERPEIAAQLDRALSGYCARLRVRPGLTGLAQVRLGADLDMDGARQKLAHDLFYIRNLNPILDLRIAGSTVFLCLEPVVKALARILVRSYRPGLRSALPNRIPSGLAEVAAAGPIIYREVTAAEPVGLKIATGDREEKEEATPKRPFADITSRPRRGADVDEALQVDFAQAA